MKKIVKVSGELVDNAYWQVEGDTVIITYQTDRELSAILAVMSRQHVVIEDVAAPDNDFQLPGYENLELSTQNMISDAIKNGIGFQVLDETEQIIKLIYGDHVEFIKAGNITRLDSALSHALMENKIVTKDILKTAGIMSSIKLRMPFSILTNYQRSLWSNQSRQIMALELQSLRRPQHKLTMSKQ